ncbi:hypothetical protein BaRGS_00034205 [Batillaria attramentaria]|uniref:Uncharacterized protein n=1 Tax=Batillaria attramentaria TaxID=370345 RepID=A0ABD0JI01_9CAEN
MKERTYGWYPAVRDIYLSKGQPTPYHLECLYKFQESGYYNPLVEPPEPSLMVRGITPSPPPSRPGSRCSSRGDGRTSRKSKSVPVPRFKPAPKLNIPTPTQCWSKSLAETPWGVVTPETTPAPPGTAAPAQEKTEKKKHHVHWPGQKIQSKYDRPYVPARTPSVFGTPIPPQEPVPMGAGTGYVFVPTGDGGCDVYSPPVVWPDSHPKPPTPQKSASSIASLGSEEGIALPAGARSSPSFRKDRVKSATTYRQKPQIPKRPVSSAGPCRPGSTTRPLSTVYEKKVQVTSPASRETRAWEESYTVRSESPTLRPRAPVPPTPSLEDLAIEEDMSSCADYDEALEKYGWVAEVHGDPYNLKKTPKRLPYTVKCAEPEIPPEPPGVHMENIETFFENTIPRRKATFDVHQEWISESLHAKRLELQKREGLKYRWKNFSFVY